MTEISLTNVCRLCLSKQNLVWVFDKRFEDANNMKCVIFVTTGVQIHTADAVSQKVCEKCCQVIIRMYEFRTKALRNDKHLREQLKKLKNDTELTPIKQEKPYESADPKQEAENNSLDIHPTIRELFHLHPHIKLPRVCLKVDVKPTVVMRMGAVEGYFSERQLNFQEHCKAALRENQTARKKTSRTAQKAKSDYFDSPPCSINGEIVPHADSTPEKGVLRTIKIKIIPKMLNIEESIPKKTKESKLQTIVECHKKRKLSETESSSTKENEKPEETAPAEKPVSYVTRVSEPLHTCNICNSVQETAKALRRHQYKHLRCQFCKVSFRTVDERTEHVDSKCLVKETMNNFPSVKLLKIENDSEVVEKYRNSLAIHFPLLNNDANIETVPISSESDQEPTSKPTPEIIEILSDDDDKPSTIPPPIKPIRPDVQINGDHMMNKINPHSTDLEVLKDQLSRKPMLVEKDVQTEHPSPSSIVVNESNMTAVFGDLKRHLHAFHVPIQIREGSSFGVSYDYSMNEPRSKSMQLWNDLTPVNIKNNNMRIPTTSAASNVKNSSTLIPATVASTPVKDVTPVSTNNSNGTSSVTSCDSKSVSSTHSRIFTVVASAVSTFPSGKRVSPPPSTISKQTEQSVSSNASSLANDAVAAPAPKKIRISPTPSEKIVVQNNPTRENTPNIPIIPPLTSSMLENMLSSSLPSITTTGAVINTSTNPLVEQSVSSDASSLTNEAVTEPAPKKIRISPSSSEKIVVQNNPTSENTPNIPVIPPSVLENILRSSMLPSISTTGAVSNTSTNSLVTVSSKPPTVTAQTWTPTVLPSELVTSKTPITSAVANTLSNSSVTASSTSAATSPSTVLPPLPLRKPITFKIPKTSTTSANSMVTVPSKTFPPNLEAIWTPPLPSRERISFKIPSLPPPNSNHLRQWRITCRDRPHKPKGEGYKDTSRPPTPYKNVSIPPPPYKNVSILPPPYKNVSIPPPPYKNVSTPPTPYKNVSTPPTPFIQTTSTGWNSTNSAISSSNVNKSVMVTNQQTTVVANYNPTVVDNNSLPMTCGTVTQPTDYPMGYSDAPTIVANKTGVKPSRHVRRPSLDETGHPYTTQIPKSVTVAHSEATNTSYGSVFNRKNAIRPQYQAPQPVQPYSEALVSLATHQAIETFNTNNSFPSAVQAHSSGNVETTSSSQVASSAFDHTYMSDICNTITTVMSNSNNSHTPPTVFNSTISQTSPVFVPILNSTPTTACSVSSLATPQFGQIRVRNMKELT